MMIINYAIMDVLGVYPLSVGANFKIPDGAVVVEDDALSYLSRMLVDGIWEERPVISEPVITPDGTVTFADLPDGAVATVVDIETGAVLGTVAADIGVIEFQLVDPARYAIEIVMPLPYMNWNGVVQC